MTIVFFALAAALFFGIALVLTQAGLRHLGPLQGAGISIPSAAILFTAFSPLTIGLDSWDAGAAGVFALIGCLFPAAVTLLTFSANRAIGPNLTGALGNLSPLFAVGFAVIALGESPGAGRIAALLIITAGVVLLYRARSEHRGGGGEGRESIQWAFAPPLLAAFIRGGVQPLAKIGLVHWPNPFAAVTIGYLVSAGVVLAAGAIVERGWPVPFRRAGWLWFSAVGVCNGLAVLGMYQALASGPVALVAPLVACYPLVTLALGWKFPGSAVMTRQTVMGVGLTVLGLAVLLNV